MKKCMEKKDIIEFPNKTVPLERTRIIRNKFSEAV